jgi:hypothetical protein
MGDITDASTASPAHRYIMTTPIVTELSRNGNASCEGAVLARYTVPTGERILFRQCVDGDVQVIDFPAHGSGPSYLVERDLEQDGPGAIEALVADYLEQSRRIRAVPMASPLAMAA